MADTTSSTEEYVQHSTRIKCPKDKSKSSLKCIDPEQCTLRYYLVEVIKIAPTLRGQNSIDLTMIQQCVLEH